MPWNSNIVDSQILAVHGAVTPGGEQGEVLLFGGDEHWRDQAEGNGDFRKTRIYDVKTGELLTAPVLSPDSDVFCSHHAFIGDGRLLVAGGTQKWPEDDGHGHGSDFLGHRRCWLFHPRQQIWREVSRLNENPDQAGEEHSGGRWYPGLVTLGTGEVLAVFGHPDQKDSRHRNNLPERFNPWGKVWSNLPKEMGSYGEPESGNRRFLFFARAFLLPSGLVFFATPMPTAYDGSGDHIHRSTAFDPRTGEYVAPQVAEPPEGGYRDWSRPAVMLPLLPAEDYRVRILFSGELTSRRLDLGAAAPSWAPTAARAASVAGRQRVHSNAVLLPTGDVCLTGGVHAVNPEDAVNEVEIYHPGVDFTAGGYNGADSWEVKEAGAHNRNYHSISLLMPNGKVLVAGGNTNEQNGNPSVVGVKQIEVYEPDYIGTANRIQILSAPKLLPYDREFEITIDRAATNVKHACLIRAGSVTHSTNNDQRFVGLTVNSRSGNSLRLQAPPHGNIAPPGYYMLWVVDTTDRPCELASWVRIASLGCTVVTDRSTFSKEEVQALGGGGNAIFSNSLYVQYDGFIHTELRGMPSFQLTWADTGVAIAAAEITLAPGGRLQEVEPGEPDVPQRITYPFHVVFGGTAAFNSFMDRRPVRVTFTLDGHVCTQTIELSHSPNPYMVDINAAENNPAWLSTDVRVFKRFAGQTFLGDGSIVQQSGQPLPFLRQALAKLNSAPNGSSLFEQLPTDEPLDLASHILFGLPTYNYAIARVRYRALTTTAHRVKVFFRMANVAATGLEFDTRVTYRSTAAGPNTVPLLGVGGGEVVAIPFFASERVATVQGQAGATSMASQTLAPGVEVLDIVPNASGAEVTVYFGCWLDINQTTKRFPISPGASDGPWPEASCFSIQELTRGRHQCLVAEIYFDQDPTLPNATPGTSDNLSQRNIALLHSDNPGGPASHTVTHPFEIKPSPIREAVAEREGRQVAAAVADYGPDELIFRWHNLPPASKVTLYFSDLDTAQIAALARLRLSPIPFEIVDVHTIRLTVAGATWLPVPGSRATHIPALLNIELPDGVRYGNQFRVSIHQVSGRTRQIIGSVEFRIPVSKAELILDEEARNLSVMKHIASRIPPGNRWWGIIKRYVHQLGLKVDALGGDARGVHPNPDGSGKPAGSPPEDGLGHLHITFADHAGLPVDDICDVFLRHYQLSDRREYRRWPTKEPLLVRDLISTHTGIYSLQVLFDHHKAHGQFVVIREGQLTRVEVRMAPSAARLAGPMEVAGEISQPAARVSYVGKVSGLRYDRFGDFAGFVLDCDQGEREFFTRENSMATLIDAAFRERSLLSVVCTAEVEERLQFVVVLPAPESPVG
ncbi:MAG: DUF1929 domain-containing protein [Bryobacterales bacterium]|nr:DUF1929 domain-containing protein [Bryobacterales bacterium]